MKALTGIVHATALPGSRVSLCGLRETGTRFSLAFKFVTCPECRVRRQRTVDARRGLPCG